MEVAGCPLPPDRRYDLEESVWILEDPATGIATVGLMASLVCFAGKFTSVTFRPIPDRQGAGRSVATLESRRYTGPVRLPVGGTLVERNVGLIARPKLLNDSPYERGWVVRVRPEPGAPPRAPLETAEEIADRLRARITELRIHCTPAAPDLELVEIGSECAATLARLDEELARRPAEEIVLLVTDDPTSPLELERWSDRTGHTLLQHARDGGLYRFLIRKEAAPRPRIRSAETGRIPDGDGPG
ncbi:MAG: sulfurtransferase TusA family protein [Thermoplasmata archaeon]